VGYEATEAQTSSTSDEDLLEWSVDRSSLFGELYRRHAQAMLVFFGRRTLDAQVAADLVAETFADAYAGRRTFRDRGPGSAAAWLYTIGRRKLARCTRRHMVEQEARRRLGYASAPLSEEDTARIEELIDFEALGRAVAGAFRHLRVKQRDALTLRILEGRSYAESAMLLGCSEEVARARVSRGLKRLAAELEF